MVLFNGIRKYSATIVLVIFCASASLAADDQTTHPENEPPVQTSCGLTSRCFTDYFNNSIIITAPEHPDMPAGSIKESLEDAVAITLHKDGDKIIWSLAPNLSKFSLNLTEDINNLQVMFKYRF